MPDITANLLIDLDDSGGYATNLCAARGAFTSGFWKIEDGFVLSGRGRTEELDEAGSTTFICSLDNATGDFGPANGSSFYASAGANRFRPYKGAKVKLIFNGTTYDMITGIIAGIKIGPEAGDQLCEVTIRDYMFVLSRTEIRRPLMLNQYTGVIIHRLLDDVEGAEGREACTNPAFAVNLNGYTTFGTATLTRMTSDDKILEGPAAMKVTTTAANSGARYTMSGKNGLKYRLSCYVRRETTASSDPLVRIRMADTVGTVATGTTTGIVEGNYWTRLDVTGTYNGGSTSQYIEIEATGSNTFRVGAVHAIPFVAAMDRDVDDGQSHLDKYSYYRGPALGAVQEVRENELGALFYFSGSGTAVFEDKGFRWKETRSLTSQVTLDERGRLDYQETADDCIKEVILDYPHYVDGEPGTEHWKTDRVINLPVGIRWPVEADYQGGLLKDTITPVAETDYVIRGWGDGLGPDFSGSVDFDFDDFGGGSVGYFTNNHTSTLYLMSYRVRGTPVRLASDRSPARYTPAGGPALAAPLSHDYQLNGSEPAIGSWAHYLGDRYSTQRPRLGLSLSAPFPESVVATSDMVSILARTVSDRVTITNNNLPFSTKVNDFFYIDSIDLRCTGESIDAQWRLSGIDSTYFNLGDTIVGGELLRP